MEGERKIEDMGEKHMELTKKERRDERIKKGEGGERGKKDGRREERSCELLDEYAHEVYACMRQF